MTTSQIKLAIIEQKRRVFMIHELPGMAKEFAWHAITVRMRLRIAADIWPCIRL